MSLYAKPIAKVSHCLQLDYKEMVESIEDGRYRFSNNPDHQQQVTFDYEVEQSFTQYLAFARQLISQKNPRAQQSCPIDNGVYKLLVKQHSVVEPAKVIDFIAPLN